MTEQGLKERERVVREAASGRRARVGWEQGWEEVAAAEDAALPAGARGARLDDVTSGPGALPGVGRGGDWCSPRKGSG